MKIPWWISVLIFAWVLVPILICATLAPLCWCSWKYGPETFKLVKDSAVHGDGLVGEARLAAKESVTASNDADTAIKAFGVLITTIQTGTLPKVGTVLDATTTLETTLNRRTIQFTGDLQMDADVAAEKLNDALDKIQTIPGHANDLMDSVRATSNESTGLVGDFRRFLNDPATAGVRDNLGTLALSGSHFLDTGTVLVGHVDTDFFAPYTGKHPKRHAAWNVTKSMLGIGTKGAEGLYYGTNIK